MPVVIAVAAAAALMQAYQSEKARGAAKARMDEIEEMFHNLVPPQYDVKIFDDPKMLAGVPEPAFNTARVSPKALELVGKYAPDAAAFIQEKAPQLIQSSDAAKEGRGAQLDALRKYQDIASQGGHSSEFDALTQQASRKAQGDAQSREQSILQDAQRRGNLGSASQLAAQMQGGAQSMQQEGDMSMQAALAAYRNQMGALDSSAQLGGQIRNSEMGEAKSNADIINSYNQRFSKDYQGYLNNQAQERNKAQIRNLDEQQQLSNQNTMMSNKADLDTVDRQNKAQMDTYNTRRQQQQDQVNLVNDKNKTLRMGYDDQYRKTAGAAGMAVQGVNQDIGFARDKNQQIQSAFDTGLKGYAAYDAGQRDDRNYKLKKDEYDSKYGE